MLHGDWEDDRYMDWADREGIIREEVRELNELFRRKAKNYRECEMEGAENERTETEY